jgi:hypothetical protein
VTFYAILTTTSVTVPGDERSRTNPGHGYPESTEIHWSIEIFETKSVWETEIKRLAKQSNFLGLFKPVVITPAKITTIIEVKIET